MRHCCLLYINLNRSILNGAPYTAGGYTQGHFINVVWMCLARLAYYGPLRFSHICHVPIQTHIACKVQEFPIQGDVPAIIPTQSLLTAVALATALPKTFVQVWQPRRENKARLLAIAASAIKH